MQDYSHQTQLCILRYLGMPGTPLFETKIQEAYKLERLRELVPYFDFRKNAKITNPDLLYLQKFTGKKLEIAYSLTETVYFDTPHTEGKRVTIGSIYLGMGERLEILQTPRGYVLIQDGGASPYDRDPLTDFYEIFDPDNCIIERRSLFAIMMKLAIFIQHVRIKNLWMVDIKKKSDSKEDVDKYEQDKKNQHKAFTAAGNYVCKISFYPMDSYNQLSESSRMHILRYLGSRAFHLFDTKTVNRYIAEQTI